MEPSDEAAKNRRSVTSHTRQDIGLGNWNVVRRDFEEVSQSYDEWVSESMPIGDQRTFTE